MPKKPRTQRQKNKRHLRNSVLPKLKEVSQEFDNLAMQYIGESDPANKLGAKCEMISSAILELYDAIEREIYPYV